MNMKDIPNQFTLMRDTVIEYFNTHGFYIVTSPGQQEIVDELVREGRLIHASENLFSVRPAPTNIYVHPYVDSKEKMPCVLHKMVFVEPPFYKGEMVYVSLLTSQGSDVKVLALVNRVRGDSIGVIIGDTDVYVPLKDVCRTFKFES